MLMLCERIIETSDCVELEDKLKGNVQLECSRIREKRKDWGGRERRLGTVRLNHGGGGHAIMIK